MKSASKLRQLSLALLLGSWLLIGKSVAADPPIPIVHLLATDPCAAEAGSETATFTVVRDGPTNAPLTTFYGVTGSAENGVDYQLLTGSVTIPAGARHAPIVVRPIDDTLVEGDEAILIVLTQPLVWPPPYIVCWPSLAFGHIEDNDFPPTNRPPAIALVNPPDGVVFMGPADIRLVARASDPDGRVRTVEFFEGANSLGILTNAPPFHRPPLEAVALDPSFEVGPELFPDFELTPGPIDPTPLPSNPFHLLWENVRPGHYIMTAVATDNDGASTRSAPVDIRVTEPPPRPIVTVVARDPIAAEPGPTANALNTAIFEVRRTGDTDLPLTVFYRLGGTASNGIDYAELPNSVTLAPGERRSEVVIAPLDDNLVGGPESVVLTVLPPICIDLSPPPPGCSLVGRQSTARAIIRDNDETNRPPVVAIVRPLDGSVFLAPADIPIVAQARDDDGRVVSVEFFEGDNSLGLVTNNPAALTPARPPFHLIWSNVPPGHYVLTAEATDNDGASTRSRPVEIKVVERTLPPVVSIVATDAEAAETGGLASGNSVTGAMNTATFSVSRTGPTERPLVVYYSLSGTASNGVDYRMLPGRLVIPSNASSANLVIEPIDDRLVEGTETVGVTLEPSICVAANPAPLNGYLVGESNRAKATIRDNDVAPTNQPPKVALVRPENGDVFVAPADIALSAEARDTDGAVRSVEFFANGASLGVVSNSLSVVGTSNVLSDTAQFFHLKWPGVGPGAYELTAKATDNRGAMTLSEPVRIKVIELQRPPLVTIEARDPFASEGDLLLVPVRDASILVDALRIDPVPIHQLPNNATFVVKRSHGTNVALTIRYRLSGTAENGIDFRLLSGEVTIPRGAWAAEIVVEPSDDAVVEGTETVIATLEPVACPLIFPPPPECYVVGEPSRAIAYIRDNDFNQPPRVEIVNPANAAVFPANADIQIDVHTRDADGYVTRVDFFAGTNHIGRSEVFFIVAPPPGQVQTFSMIWSNVSPGDYRLTTRATDNAGAVSVSDPIKISVLDRQRVPVVTIETIDKVASEQSPLVLAPLDVAILQVTRTGPTNRPLDVNYSVSGTAQNGVDYRRLSGVVTIPAGAESERIIVEAIDDALIEDIESVVLQLEPSDCITVDPAPPGCYLVGAPSRAEAFIRDNDRPPDQSPYVAILIPSEGETFAAPADIDITAVALDPDGWVTEIQFYEGTNVIGGLAILVGNPPPIGQLQVFHFRWDAAPPGQHALTARVADNRGATTVSAPVHVRVIDPCLLPVVTISASDPIATEQDSRLDSLPDTATFTVHRTCRLDEPLLVRYSVSGTAQNGVDYARLTGQVLFQAGESSARILVLPIDDDLPEGTESVIVTLDQPNCLGVDPTPAGCYLVGRPGRAVAQIRDNDTFPPRVAILSPRNGQIFEAPGQIPILVHALDPDGYVTRVEFFEGSNSIGAREIVFIVAPPPGQLQEFTLRWTNVAAGHYVLTAVATDDTGATTRSDPVEINVAEPSLIPVVGIIATDPIAREGTTNTATFLIRRSGRTNEALTVHYAIRGTASNGVDYALIPDSITVPAGRRSARIVITPVDDKLPERIETVVLQLLEADSYNLGRPRRAAALILDNDHPEPPCLELPDGLVHLRAPGERGFCYRLEASGDLVKWETLFSNVIVEDAMHFVDADAPDLPRRYFRVLPDLEIPGDE